MKRVIAAAIMDEDKILLCRKARLPYYIFPGGKPDASDRDDIATLIREVKEELGCIPNNIEYIQYFNSETPNGDKISVLMYRADLIGIPTPNAEIVEILWYDIKQEKSLLYPFTPMTQMFIDYLKEEL